MKREGQEYIAHFTTKFSHFIKYNSTGTFPCKNKNCSRKKKNGRCKLKEIKFDGDFKCKDFIEKGCFKDRIFGDK